MAMLWEKTVNFENPKPAFDALVEAWNGNKNKVFVLRGENSQQDVKTFYTGNFHSIGTPIPLAEDVRLGDRKDQRTGRIWTEVRFDPTFPDAYRHSSEAQPLHTDGSYIPDFPNATLMICVANAAVGGETTFLSGKDLVACLQSEKPELLDELHHQHIRHSRSGDKRVEKIIDISQSPILLNWNYYCIDTKSNDEQKQLAEEFFSFLQNSEQVKNLLLKIKLCPGDSVMWKDRQVLHGRNGFSASTESERFLWKCAIDVGRFEDQ